jgi:two-component system sensor histidine kinase BarA
MPRLSSVRGKLIALICGAVALAEAAAATLSAWQAAERYAAEKSETLIATAQVLAAATAEAAAIGDARAAYSAIRAVGRIRGVSYVEASTRDGRILADLGLAERLSTDLRIGPSAPRIPIRSLLSSHTIEVEAPLVAGGVDVGALRMVADTRDFASHVLSDVETAAAGGVLGLTLALALALRLQRTITDPLRRLTSTMRHVKDHHDYSARMAQETSDEIGVLIAGFNTMIGDIRDRDARLKRHLSRLEQDVADRTRDYRNAANEAQAANQAKSDFLATMSHEIRTPMNGIMVMAELLTMSDLPGRARRHAEVIAKSGQSLLAIINDILDLSKIEAGRMEVETLDVDPVEAAENVLRLFSARARSKGLDLALHAKIPPGALIAADPVRLSQVLGNLINNALKFTETGSVTLDIAPDPADPERIRFQVVDTGIGIDADKRETIFDAFSQADQTTTRRFGGTGLGLAIGKKLVAAMGGDLAVVSEAGRGSTFHFSLPASMRSVLHSAPQAVGLAPLALVTLKDSATLASAVLYLGQVGLSPQPGSTPLEPDLLAAAGLALTTPEALRRDGRPALAPGGVVAMLADPAEPTDDLVSGGIADRVLQYPLTRAEVFELAEWIAAGRPAEAPVASVTRRETTSYPGARVLVADDSPVNLEVAQSALARLGVSATTVVSGREAFEAFRRQAWDLILMDGSMPDMDGFEAARAIRACEQREGRARTPIVALTAHVVGTAADAWRSADMDGVLHKPYRLAELAAGLERHLRPGAVTPPPQPTENAPAPAKANSTLLDPAALEGLREMSGDAALVARVARLYCATAPTHIAELREAVAAADVRRSASAAHALKSMSLNIGARAMAASAARIEQNARDCGQPAEAADVDQLAELAEQTFIKLREEAA